jgi:hypothetical protein
MARRARQARCSSLANIALALASNFGSLCRSASGSLEAEPRGRSPARQPRLLVLPYARFCSHHASARLARRCPGSRRAGRPRAGPSAGDSALTLELTGPSRPLPARHPGPLATRRSPTCPTAPPPACSRSASSSQLLCTLALTLCDAGRRRPRRRPVHRRRHHRLPLPRDGVPRRPRPVHLRHLRRQRGRARRLGHPGDLPAGQRHARPLDSVQYGGSVFGCVGSRLGAVVSNRRARRTGTGTITVLPSGFSLPTTYNYLTSTPLTTFTVGPTTYPTTYPTGTASLTYYVPPSNSRASSHAVAAGVASIAGLVGAAAVLLVGAAAA